MVAAAHLPPLRGGGGRSGSLARPPIILQRRVGVGGVGIRTGVWTGVMPVALVRLVLLVVVCFG